MGQLHATPYAIVPEWVLDADVSDRAVRLFAILARYADADGRAFPGRPKLAKRLRCSSSSIDRAVEELAAIAAVVTTARFRDDGSRSSNDYWLWPSTPPVGVALLTSDEGGLVTGDDALSPPVTTQSKTQVIQNQLIENDARGGFDTFWTAYPRKVARPEAEKAWNAAVTKAKVDPAAVMAGLAAWSAYWAARNAPEFVPHPSTWLRQQRWNDEPPAAPRQNGGVRAPITADRERPSGVVSEL